MIIVLTYAAEGVDRIVALNPRLSLLSLSQCRGIPVRARRNYFDTEET